MMVDRDLCEFCGEHECVCPWPCEVCGTGDLDPDFEHLEDGRWLCERCQKKEEQHAWIDATERTIEQAAQEHGWSMHLDSIAQTNSRYYTVSRLVRGAEQTDEDVEDYGFDEIESFTLRLSDHGDCYCNADYSLARQPSGDDTTLEAVAARLARPPHI